MTGNNGGLMLDANDSSSSIPQRTIHQVNGYFVG